MDEIHIAHGCDLRLTNPFDVTKAKGGEEGTFCKWVTYQRVPMLSDVTGASSQAKATAPPKLFLRSNKRR